MSGYTKFQLISYYEIITKVQVEIDQNKIGKGKTKTKFKQLADIHFKK